jgi:DNA (cytosine-5)-methyltransferase 1
MSWLFSRVLVEEFLEANSLDGEQSVQSNGKHTPQAYCAPDKMTAFSRLSQFGMTFDPLTVSNGEKLLTWYLAVSPARTYPLREKAMDSMEQEVPCGLKWRGWLAKYDPDSCSLKTAQCSLLEGEPESLQTLPRWGMTVDGLLWEQPTLELITNGTGCGLSPNGETTFHTPNTTGLDGGSNSRKALRKRQETFPTPTASDHKDQPTSASWKAKGAINYKLSNPEIRAMWPTPNTRDWKDSGISQGNRKSPNLGTKVHWPTPTATMMPSEGAVGAYRRLVDMNVLSVQEAEGMLEASLNPPRMKKWTPQTEQPMDQKPGGKLNPTWVEWLMGWPLGWTDLKPLEMDKCLYVQQPHGNGSPDELL